MVAIIAGQLAMNEFDIAIAKAEADSFLSNIEDLDEFAQKEAIAVASEGIDDEQEQESPQIESEAQVTPKEKIVFDPERPYSFNDSLREQNRILGVLDSKLKKIDNKSLNGEAMGIFWDFKKELENLAQETQKIVNFFSTEISQEDKELINRTTLLKNNLVELYDLTQKLKNEDYAKQIHDTNKKLGDFIKSTSKRIEYYDNNVKSAFSANLKSLADLLKEFYDRELNDTNAFTEDSKKLIADSHQKFKDISNDFELTSKKLKVFGFAMLMAFIALGVCLGILGSVTYRKYAEYSEIESRMDSLSKRIQSVAIRKNKNNDVIFQIPKENAYLKENHKLYEITIKEVQ